MAVNSTNQEHGYNHCRGMAAVQSNKPCPNFSEELHAMISAVQQRKIILLAKFDNNVMAKTRNSAWKQAWKPTLSISPEGKCKSNRIAIHT